MAQRVVCSVLAAVVLFAGVNLANAAGYWNVPSNFCQWCGCGFGGGYHAPLMLGPPQCDCFRGPNEVRLPCAPNPYACQPSCNGGCGGYQGGAPMMMPVSQPMMQPAPEAQNVTPEAMPQVISLVVPQEELPTNEPRGALFAAPVER